MKKVITLLLILAVCLSLFPFAAYAEGDASDFQVEEGVLIKYTGTDAVVTVPDGITTIGRHAFDRSSVTSVILPDSVTAIKGQAFVWCENLKDLTIPASVNEIAEDILLTDEIVTIHGAVGSCAEEWAVFPIENIDAYDAMGGMSKPAYPFSADLPAVGTSATIYQVALDPNGGSVSASSVTVKSGETYGELPVPTREGHIFDGWYTSTVSGVKRTASDIVSITGPRTLYAIWVDAEQTTPDPSQEPNSEQSVSAMTEEDQERNRRIVAMQSSYPEGMPWNNGNLYTWGSGVYASYSYYNGYGCMGLAMIMCDAAYGKEMAAVKKTSFSYEDLRVGDILRINGDTHSVAVLEIYSDHVVIVEGNYNSSVHWGRVLSKDAVARADYMITRVPAVETPAETPSEAPAETPEPAPKTEAPAQPAKPEDVAKAIQTDGTVSSWAKEEMEKAAGLGLILSDLTGNFKGNTTRKDFCRLAVNLLEKKTGKTAEAIAASTGASVTGRFTDTADREILIACALGIVNGKGNNRFDPDGSITRREAAAMLMRTAKLLNKDSGTGRNFSDLGDTPAWATEAITYISSLNDPATGNAVMGGVGSGRFSPLGAYTREQSIVTIYRLFQAVG